MKVPLEDNFSFLWIGNKKVYNRTSNVDISFKEQEKLHQHWTIALLNLYVPYMLLTKGIVIEGKSNNYFYHRTIKKTLSSLQDTHEINKIVAEEFLHDHKCVYRRLVYIIYINIISIILHLSVKYDPIMVMWAVRI